MSFRKVRTEAEAAEVMKAALEAVERATGVGSIVLVPMEFPDGRMVMTINSRAEGPVDRVKLLQVGVECVIQAFVQTYEETYREEYQVNAQGIGATPPTEVMAMGMMAFEVMKPIADGILFVIHSKAKDADGNDTGAVHVVVDPDLNDPVQEMRVLADLGPQLVARWSKGALETLGARAAKEGN